MIQLPIISLFPTVIDCTRPQLHLKITASPFHSFIFHLTLYANFCQDAIHHYFKVTNVTIFIFTIPLIMLLIIARYVYNLFSRPIFVTYSVGYKMILTGVSQSPLQPLTNPGICGNMFQKELLC